MIDLSNKNIRITGASRGIGAAIARGLLVFCFAGFGLSGCNERPTDTELFQFAEMLCERGNGSGIGDECYQLGLFHYQGFGTETNRQQAVVAFQRSCDLDYADGCIVLGGLLNEGAGENRPAAAEAFQKACRADAMAGCHNLALMYRQHRLGAFDLERDRINMLQYYQQACGTDFAQSCLALGYMHQTGDTVPEDSGLAVNYYDQACQLDFELGCKQLEEMSADFNLGEEFHAELAARLREACGMSSANACAYLGILYHRGTGVTQNTERARDLLDQSCDDGAAVGCSTLARLYEEGVGVTVNARRARRYSARACELDPENRC